MWFFNLFVKQIWSRYAGNFVYKSKMQKSPKLATLFNHEDSKICDFQSKIQSSLQWIFAQDFDLIPFLYIYMQVNPNAIHVKKLQEKPLQFKKIGKKTQN